MPGAPAIASSPQSSQVLSLQSRAAALLQRSRAPVPLVHEFAGGQCLPDTTVCNLTPNRIQRDTLGRVCQAPLTGPLLLPI